jgi:hypothetical protein
MTPLTNNLFHLTHGLKIQIIRLLYQALLFHSIAMISYLLNLRRSTDSWGLFILVFLQIFEITHVNISSSLDCDKRTSSITECSLILNFRGVCTGSRLLSIIMSLIRCDQLGSFFDLIYFFNYFFLLTVMLFFMMKLSLISTIFEIRNDHSSLRLIY